MPSPKKKASLVLPSFSGDAAEVTEYQKLERFLLAHRDHFALGLVRVNSPLQRDGVIAALRDDLRHEGLELKILDYSQRQLPNLYEELRRDDEVRAMLEKRAQGVALAIVGLEGSIELPPRPGTGLAVFLATLNLQRDNLAAAFPIPITLWLSDFAMDRLAEGAPDFFDLFGALFTFRHMPVEGTRQVEQPITSRLDLISLPPAELDAQIDLLQDRLNELRRRRDRLTPVEKQRLAEILEQLGEVHLKFKDKGAAAHYFREARETYQELGDHRREVEFLSRLGEACIRSYQWPRAADCYEQALPIYKEIGARLGEANTIQALGDVHMSQAQYELARQRYDIALGIYRTIKDRYSTAWTLYHLGLTYVTQEQIDPAQQLLKEALILFETIGIERGTAACKQALSRLPVQLAQVAEAGQDYDTTTSKPQTEEQ